MSIININGKLTETGTEGIPVDNGAFRYGYGLFETMRYVGGRINLGKLHWERLYNGLQTIWMELPRNMTREYLEDQVHRTVHKNKLDDMCRVRLQVFAGGGGMMTSEAEKAGFVIECFPLAPETFELNTNGLVIGMASGVQKSADVLANLKSCNALVYAVAARHAKAQKWNDALICNTDNRIIESTICNIFWVKDNEIYTPPLKDGCVEGVMRKHVLAMNPHIREHSLTLTNLLAADEVLLTNAIRGIKWAGSLGEKTYRCTMAKELAERI